MFVWTCSIHIFFPSAVCAFDVTFILFTWRMCWRNYLRLHIKLRISKYIHIYVWTIFGPSESMRAYNFEIRPKYREKIYIHVQRYSVCGMSKMLSISSYIFNNDARFFPRSFTCYLSHFFFSLFITLNK